jgi:hypothetical protein
MNFLQIVELVMTALSVIGGFACVAPYTPNSSGNRKIQRVLNGINHIAQNRRLSKNL